MAIKSADQISIIDLTDGYSVILTSDGYTFPGTTATAKAGSCTTQIVAMRGSEQIPASVTLADITKPTGITVTKDNDATSPTLTITASTSFAAAGVVKIPVVLEDGSITINKSFAVSIAFTGSQGAKGDTGSTGNGVRLTIFGGYIVNICSKHDYCYDGTEFVGIGIKPDIETADTYQSFFVDNTDPTLQAALDCLGMR